MKRVLQVYFVAVLLALTWASVYATTDGFSGHIKNVLVGYQETWAQPWGMATLFDAYFAFLVFFLWVAYKEKSLGARIAWFVLIMAGGNFAISSYMLIQLSKLKKNEGFEKMLLRSKSPRG